MKLYLLPVIVLLLSSYTTTRGQNIPVKNAATLSDTAFSQIVHLRRLLHRHPELGGSESQTQQRIIEELTSLGLRVKTSEKSKAVVAVLQGAHPGKTVAWRADMDALPMDLQESSHYASPRAGISHACGHDVHMAIALGIARLLVGQKDQLHGSVYFIFQPEEETFMGAKGMLQDDAFGLKRVDEIYGLHVTALPAGEIMLRPGEIFAYQKRVSIRLDPRTEQHKLLELAKAISDKLGRNKGLGNPADLSRINDRETGLASPTSRYSDYCIVDEHPVIINKDNEILLSMYLYETEEKNLGGIIPTIEAIVDAIGMHEQLRAMTFVQQNPTVQNNERLAMAAWELLQADDKSSRVKWSHGQIPYFNDDFAYFQQQIPGVYFLLGGSNAQQGIVAMNHSPNFAIDEACLRVGVDTFANLIFKRLQ